MFEPYGSYAESAAKLRRMLALCPEWRKQCGAQSYDDAFSRVLQRDAGDGELRPHAVVNLGNQHTWRAIAGGSQVWLRPSGALTLYLAIDTPPEFEGDATQCEAYAGSILGQIVDELASMSGADDPGSETSHLSINQINLVAFDETPEELWKSLGRFWWAIYECTWSDGDA